MKAKFTIILMALLISLAGGLVYAGGPSEVDKLINESRAATEKYKHLDKALEDGYVKITDCIEGQGEHYLSPDLLDGEVDHRNPEILVYWEGELVAVEYATPDTVTPIPSLFDEEFHHLPEVELHVLHAWIHHKKNAKVGPNPNGTFANFHPDVIC